MTTDYLRGYEDGFQDAISILKLKLEDFKNVGASPLEQTDDEREFDPEELEFK